MRNVRLVNTIGSGVGPHMKELRRKRCTALMTVWREILPQMVERGLGLRVDPGNYVFTVTGAQYGTI